MTTTWELHEMDCRLAMGMLMDADSVDSIVCDPPYGLSKEPDMAEVMRHWLAGDDYTHEGSGFMGKSWDSFVPGPSVWREAYRVLKPGGHLVAFFGTRTYDLGVLALRLAGFEIRDQLAWVFGQGFPKSHNISQKLSDFRCLCDGRTLPNTHGRTEEIPERGMRCLPETDVSEAVDPRAQHPEVLQHGLPQQNLRRADDGSESGEGVEGCEKCGLEGWRHAQTPARELLRCPICALSAGGFADGAEGRLHHGASVGDGQNVRLSDDSNGSGQPYRSRSVEQSSKQSGALADQRGPQTWGGWEICRGCGKPHIPEGLGSALKPAYEPIVLARKPLVGTVARNVLSHGTGALNIDGCRVGTESTRRTSNAGTNGAGWGMGATANINGSDRGRWPANLAHDGSPEVLAEFPDSKGQLADQSTSDTPRNGQNIYGAMKRGNEPSADSENEGTVGFKMRPGARRGDSGSAARFFYCAKASKSDRNAGLDDLPEQPSAASEFRPNHTEGAANGEDGNPYGRWSPVRNTHPTVKPTALMQWLVRLVTPPGGLVLDPFTGSGSTGKAAMLEGFSFVGCEMDPDYAKIARLRIDHAVNSR